MYMHLFCCALVYTAHTHTHHITFNVYAIIQPMSLSKYLNDFILHEFGIFHRIIAAYSFFFSSSSSSAPFIRIRFCCFSFSHLWHPMCYIFHTMQPIYLWHTYSHTHTLKRKGRDEEDGKKYCVPIRSSSFFKSSVSISVRIEIR